MKARARFIIVALVTLGLFAVMRSHNDTLSTSPQILPPTASGHVFAKTQEFSTSTHTLPALPPAEVLIRELPSDTSRKVGATFNNEVSVGLSAEPNPNLNEAFQVELNIDSGRPAGRFTVTVNYDPHMLRLVGVRSSEFVVRPTDIADFTVRIPADTEGQLIVSWDGQSIWGVGVLGHVEFELYASGSTEITLSDVEVLDVEGRAVQVAIPEPVRVERHIS